MEYKRIAIFFTLQEIDKYGYMNVYDAPGAKDVDKKIQKHLNEGWEIVSVVPITAIYLHKEIINSKKMDKMGYTTTGREKFENTVSCPYTQNIEVLLVKKQIKILKLI